MSNDLKAKVDKDRPIPDIIVNPQTKRRYLKGKFLGKVRKKGQIFGRCSLKMFILGWFCSMFRINRYGNERNLGR